MEIELCSLKLPGLILIFIAKHSKLKYNIEKLSFLSRSNFHSVTCIKRTGKLNDYKTTG